MTGLLDGRLEEFCSDECVFEFSDDHFMGDLLKRSLLSCEYYDVGGASEKRRTGTECFTDQALNLIPSNGVARFPADNGSQPALVSGGVRVKQDKVLRRRAAAWAHDS